MTRRDQAGTKSFNQRSGGVMKKANELRKKTGVKIAVFIQDGGDWYSYRSEPDWPPSTANIGGIVKLPADFVTQREAEEENREHAELLLLPSLPQPNVPQAPMLQAPTRQVPVPQSSVTEVFQPQISLSHVQSTDISLNLGENDMLNFGNEYFDPLADDFQEVFAFPPKAFLPFTKVEGDESFKTLQNAPTYAKGMMRGSPLPTPQASQRKPSTALRSIVSHS